MPTNRDPRLDPRKGDILRASNGRRQREVVGGAAIGYTRVVVLDGTVEPRKKTTPTLEQFRRWARNAEVVHAA